MDRGLSFAIFHSALRTLLKREMSLTPLLYVVVALYCTCTLSTIPQHGAMASKVEVGGVMETEIIPFILVLAEWSVSPSPFSSSLQVLLRAV